MSVGNNTTLVAGRRYTFRFIGNAASRVVTGGFLSDRLVTTDVPIMQEIELISDPASGDLSIDFTYGGAGETVRQAGDRIARALSVGIGDFFFAEANEGGFVPREPVEEIKNSVIFAIKVLAIGGAAVLLLSLWLRSKPGT
jgi:hypothetical protein